MNIPDNRLILHLARGGEAGLPVTGGIPFACGQVPSGAVFSLAYDRQAAQPLQTQTLARWDDRSVRWLLLDSLTPDSRRSAKLTLLWHPADRKHPIMKAESPVRLIRRDYWTLANQHAAIVLTPGGLLRINDGWEMELYLKYRGKHLTAKLTNITLEAKGSLRTTVLGHGGFTDAKGQRLFGLRLRVSLFAGGGRMRIEPMILFDNAEGAFHHVAELCCRLVKKNASERAGLTVGTGNDALELDGRRHVRLFQRDDQYSCIEGEKPAPCSTRAPGWAVLRYGMDAMSLAVKDFWQLWPKSIERREDSLVVGLLPRCAKDSFRYLQPDHKYQYLFKGNRYGLRTGQACRWELWLEPGDRAETMAAMVAAPPVIGATSEQVALSGQMGLMVPRDRQTAKFDRIMDGIIKLFMADRDKRRDYGQMNYGDWHGERRVNWGNNEYDTPRHLLVHFARNADAACLDYGLAAARHMSEVDLINFVNQDLKELIYAYDGEQPDYPVRPGMVHEHTMGHVSGHFSRERIRRLFVANGVGFNRNPYQCTDPYNLGHIWTTGLSYAYFLTGDTWFREAVYRIGENLALLVEDGKRKFAGFSHSGRCNGWPMLALAGAYSLDRRKRFLQAMKKLADIKLEEQDPVCGGWMYDLPQGNCPCVKRKHVGESGFLTAIMLNALAEYYRLSRDARIPPAIDKALTNLNRESWDETRAGWRASSCPASPFTGQDGRKVEALANSALIGGNPEHLRMLRKAWKVKFAALAGENDNFEGIMLGKTLANKIIGCHAAMYALFAEED